jgi:hypothetical protein
MTTQKPIPLPDQATYFENAPDINGSQFMLNRCLTLQEKVTLDINYGNEVDYVEDPGNGIWINTNLIYKGRVEGMLNAWGFIKNEPVDSKLQPDGPYEILLSNPQRKLLIRLIEGSLRNDRMQRQLSSEPTGEVYPDNNLQSADLLVTMLRELPKVNEPGLVHGFCL